MSSLYPAPFTHLHFTIQPSLLNTHFFFSNSYRSHYSKTQHGKLVVLTTLSLSSTNPIENSPVHGNYLVDKNEGLSIKQEEKNLDFDKKTSRFQVQELVDKISALPSTERTEFLSAYLKDGDFGTISEVNDVLMALFMAEESDLALKLFSDLSCYELEPDSWTFSIVLRCYCKKNNLDEAKQVLEHMVEEKGFQPDVVTITILINALCKRGRVQRAFEVFDFMGRIGCKPTVQTYNCLLKGLCYVGKVEQAFEMLVKIKKDSMKPDIYTYTAVMDGYCKVGRSDEAMELLNEALEMGLTPNVVTYNTLFHGYCKEGRPLEGIGVLKQMKQRNCMPDYISYSTLLHGLLKWRKIRSALRTYKEMMEDGIEVDKRIMNALLRGLCRKSWKEKDLLEEAYEVFEKMKIGFYDIDPSTYCLMIQALCKGGKIEKSLDNLHDMIRMGNFPGIITFNSVIQALCAGGRVDEALLVLVLMDERVRIPSRMSYNLLIEGYNRQRWLLVACSIYGAALKRGVIPNSKPRSRELM
uniref:Pentacotripeptide-repeat region of PRORP domain-containing protein n=1 Tax=Fagus sylvatica TaxID=28930 RepID=A0A2N9I1F4_FAGSY